MTLKPYKSDFSHSYSFGVFPTLELVSHRPNQLLQLIVSPKAEHNSGLTKILQTKDVPVISDAALIKRLGGLDNSYVVGVFSKFITQLLPQKNHVVLVGIRDMGNLGTIIRTLVGFAITDIAIIKPACDIFDPRVVRASMGAIFQINFSYFADFPAYQNQFKNHNFYPFLTTANQQLTTNNFIPPYSLIFGSESSGLPDEFISLGTPVKIPQNSQIDSLNLSTAVALAAYTAYTQNSS